MKCTLSNLQTATFRHIDKFNNRLRQVLGACSSLETLNMQFESTLMKMDEAGNVALLDCLSAVNVDIKSLNVVIDSEYFEPDVRMLERLRKRENFARIATETLEGIIAVAERSSNLHQLTIGCVQAHYLGSGADTGTRVLKSAIERLRSKHPSARINFNFHWFADGYRVDSAMQCLE